MALNIKNERVHELAREAARVSGGTQTSAIQEALVLYLREHDVDPAARDHERRLRRMLAMGERFRREERVPASGVMTVADLYDERTGLPR
ncbi:MAG TPA: type II toxin-antitoxin system VapB family antitoxin [Microbacterium sp.]|nr:type II toxin-antitoxin system VapB family antitoxin [Microbacterium sp.]